MPVKPGHYCWKKTNDVQINYFLDFLQHGGVIQDVASGTFSAKLSSSRKTSIPNAIRMVPKAEFLRLYISACNKQGYTQKACHPSERTLWNILKNCPASQRKSLAGLDNEASKGLDAFDKLITICKLNGTNHTERPVKAITDS